MIAFIIQQKKFYAILACVFAAIMFFRTAEAKELPVCKDSPPIDKKLEQKCAIDTGRIKLAIPFPGVREFKYYPIEVRSQPTGEGSKQEFCYYQEEKKCYYVSNMIEYIQLLYMFLVGVIGIVGTAMLTYGGYQWILARGNSSEIEKAKETIKGSVAGVVIALLSYVILATINPALVGLKQPITPPIPPINIGKVCKSESQAVPIDFSKKGLLKGNVSDARLHPNTLAALYKAAEAASGLYTITVTSAFRSFEKQDELYQCYKEFQNTKTCPTRCGECNEASEPNCDKSPHLLGIAVDACITTKSTGDTTCGMLTKANNDPKNSTISMLQLIMKNAGFSRYCGEWWHFELPKASPECEPGVYK